ncbi:MAG: RraA family protein [Paraburkholderia tropica]|uniref:Putative 4-hydroxy-4-methyl-2-oxoglutarate aldolase n=1 Tax=Paraburkholderia tropica TaxID=92647 RepID=A0ABX5MIZ3_9BURK|nr:RraA family protein [Paraburkholderia tropica]PXX12550.1 regulator of RNase E activity RraA [Paraburkholderia tropica]PZW76527.1 regulator of RNase E activity RraA [Paraburkholderia tropica]
MENEINVADRENIRQRYLRVDTSNVADVLDNLNVPNQGLAPEFTPFPADAGQLAGWAYTIRGQNTPFPMGGDADKMAACQGVSAGDITVWSGDGDGTCYFGELIAIGMKERGSVGALVDGGIRDVRWLKKQEFPVFARYRSPVQSIARWKVNGCQVPVFLRGATVKFVTVNPGDFILADEDGAIIIPHHLVVQVLEEAERLTNIEVAIRSELAQGLSLSEALKKFGHV